MVERKKTILARFVNSPFTEKSYCTSTTKVGDVILIEGDLKNKLLWKLGKIQRAILGRDGNIRSYEIKTVNGILKRSIQHLYPLDL